MTHAVPGVGEELIERLVELDALDAHVVTVQYGHRLRRDVGTPDAHQVIQTARHQPVHALAVVEAVDALPTSQAVNHWSINQPANQPGSQSLVNLSVFANRR